MSHLIHGVGRVARYYPGLHRFEYFEIACFDTLGQENPLEIQNMKPMKKYKDVINYCYRNPDQPSLPSSSLHSSNPFIQTLLRSLFQNQIYITTCLSSKASPLPPSFCSPLQTQRCFLNAVPADSVAPLRNLQRTNSSTCSPLHPSQRNPSWAAQSSAFLTLQKSANCLKASHIRRESKTVCQCRSMLASLSPRCSK
jgi:hypothetical protein